MLKYVKGNLLDAPQQIIVHQVNCQGVMGSGVAKSIREKYPEAYKQYKIICLNSKKKDTVLGLNDTFTVLIAPVYEHKVTKKVSLVAAILANSINIGIGVTF